MIAITTSSSISVNPPRRRMSAPDPPTLILSILGFRSLPLGQAAGANVGEHLLGEFLVAVAVIAAGDIDSGAAGVVVEAGPFAAAGVGGDEAEADEGGAAAGEQRLLRLTAEGVDPDEEADDRADQEEHPVFEEAVADPAAVPVVAERGEANRGFLGMAEEDLVLGLETVGVKLVAVDGRVGRALV